MEGRSLMEGICRRRRLLPCSFWFLLLFSAGGLVLFIHLQDLVDHVPNPGVKQGGVPRQARETLCTQQRQGVVPESLQQGAEGSSSRPVHPMQFPDFELGRAPPGPPEPPDLQGSPRVTQRHRKLLKTSPAGGIASRGGERWRGLAQALEERRQLMRDTCRRYGAGAPRAVTRRHLAHVYVEDRYRLLYCQVPKAGCSNWKRTLMVLAGRARDTRSIQHDTAHYANQLRRLDSLERAGVARRLARYTKVVFVREPLERLVSAYRDKFESPNAYYHALFGRPIIARYRANASRAALDSGAGVTFGEFVRYLLDVQRPGGMDVHWEPAHQLCSPCLLDYDFIGKVENMQEESDFLLRRSGAPSNLTLPSFKDRNPGAERTSMGVMRRYLAQVSPWERQRIYDFYYMDYLMFNYSKPFQDLY